MSLSAFLLVVIAAVLHALWNLVAKRASGNIGVFWLGLCFAASLLLPIAALAAQPPPTIGLPYILATALIHTVYFALLSASYRHGEMSVVYTLARGTGVAGTALAAFLLIGEPVSALGATGILFVCAGILLMGVREWHMPASSRAYLLALLVGLSIVAYSIVDKLGVAHVHPLVYIAGLAAGTALFLSPWMLLRFHGECADAWRQHKLQSACVGLGSMGTYVLILFAFQESQASYVVAVRELSIVVVAGLSVAVLRERITVQKGVAIAAILIGVVLVKAA